MDRKSTHSKQSHKMSKTIKHTKFKAKHKQQKDKYKKFKGNVKEGQGFADNRKNAAVREYKKMLHKERKKEAWTKGTTVSAQKERKPIREPPKVKMTAIEKAELVYGKKKKIADKAQEESTRKQEERGQALKQYQKKKNLTIKKIGRKNYKGQPNMASQMELLLAKIQASQS